MCAQAPKRPYVVPLASPSGRTTAVNSGAILPTRATLECIRPGQSRSRHRSTVASQADVLRPPGASSGLRRWGAGPGRAGRPPKCARAASSPARRREERFRAGEGQLITGARSDREQVAFEGRSSRGVSRPRREPSRAVSSPGSAMAPRRGRRHRTDHRCESRGSTARRSVIECLSSAGLLRAARRRNLHPGPPGRVSATRQARSRESATRTARSSPTEMCQ